MQTLVDQKGLFQSTPEEPILFPLLYLSLSHRAQGSLSSPRSGCWPSLALGSWAQVLWVPVTESLLDFGTHTFSRSSWKPESCFRSCTGPSALRVSSAPAPRPPDSGTDMDEDRITSSRLPLLQDLPGTPSSPEDHFWAPILRRWADLTDSSWRHSFTNLSASPYTVTGPFYR